MIDYNLYVQNEKQWRARCEHDFLINEEATVQKIDRGVILPLKRITTTDRIFYKGGVCDKNFSFVAGLARDHRLIAKLNPPYKSCLSSYQVDQKEIVLRDETVIFGGVLDPTFGHFLTESISRLWYVIKQKTNLKIVFLLAMEERAWMYDFFSLLGIPSSQVEFIRVPTQFAEIIIPDETLFLFSGYKKEANIIYEKLRSTAFALSPIDKGEKLYLTRSHYEKNDVINEKYFEKYYSQKGYEIVAPEGLTIAEQISVISKAKELSSTLGTLSHFSIFMEQGSRQVILNRTNNHYLKAQIIINQLRGVRYTLVDVSNNYLPVNHVGGVFLLEPTKHWAAYLADQGEMLEELTEEEKARNAYIFLKEWHENYINRKGSIHGLKKFVNYDLADVLEHLHLVFEGEKIKRSTYGYKYRKSDLIERIAMNESLKTRIYSKIVKLAKKYFKFV